MNTPSLSEIKQMTDIKQLFDLDLIANLFNMLHINYSVIDRNGDYIIQNNALMENSNKERVKAQEIDPVSWADCVSVLEKGEKKLVEEYFAGKHYLSVKLPIQEDGEFKSIIIVSIDITAQKEAEDRKIKAEAEALRERIKTMEIFEGSIAHELRNPLLAIK